MKVAQLLHFGNKLSTITYRKAERRELHFPNFHHLLGGYISVLRKVTYSILTEDDKYRRSTAAKLMLLQFPKRNENRLLLYKS